MAVSAQDLIYGALKLISSLTPGDPIPGDEVGSCLIALNDLLGSWSAESNMPAFNVTETFAMTQGQKKFTIGTSGTPDFNTARPDEIQDVYFTDTNSNIDYDGEFLTQEQYDAIALKTVGTIPHWIWYNPQFPNGEINAYPVAGNSNFTMTIVSLKPVAQFSSLNATIDLPPQYPRAIKLLLADYLAFEYGFEMPQRLIEEIERARAMLKSKNSRRITAEFDPIFSRKGSFSILTG